MKHRYFHYFLFFTKEGKLLMRERHEKDIWKGLFDFYLVEAGSLSDPDAISDPVLQQLLTENSILHRESEVHKHQLSHQLLHVKFFELEVSNQSLQRIAKQQASFGAYSLAETGNLPKPILITNYLRKLNF